MWEVVADVVIAIDGKFRCIGEIKGDTSTGYTQTLAAMQAVAGDIKEWPFGESILGL